MWESHLSGPDSLPRAPSKQRSIQVNQMIHQIEITEEHSWRDFVPATALLVVSAVGIFAATLSPSADRGLYAVMAPPWYSVTQTVGLVSRAGGDLVDFGGLANVVIVHSANPRFVRALYRAGAWLVIDPVLLRGCLRVERDPPPASGAA
jgi:hypothetical protein